MINKLILFRKSGNYLSHKKKLLIFRRKKHLSLGNAKRVHRFIIERVFWKRVQAGKKKLHKVEPSLEKEDSRCLHVIHLSPQLK